MQKLETEFLENGGEFKEYKIGDVFEIQPTKAYKLNNADLFKNNGSTPVVTNSSLNNGISGYSSLEPTEKGNMITYSDTTTSDGIFYQPNDFIGYSHIQGLYPKINKDKWSEKTLLYFVILFKKCASGRFDYGNKFNRKIASEMQIFLPTQNGEIDFVYMENYIAELEQERITELEEERVNEINAYLQVTGLSDYILTKKESNALEKLNGGVNLLIYN